MKSRNPFLYTLCLSSYGRILLATATVVRKIFSSLIGFNQSWAGAAPVLILGVAKTKFSHNGTDNHNALYDLGAASSYLTLQAAALGLTTHQMAGFDSDAARQAYLGLYALQHRGPEDYAFGAVIALGHQGEPSALPHPDLITHEIAPRTRKPLSEVVLSSWGTPANLG